jgi:predicted ATPase with chaperone activity
MLGSLGAGKSMLARHLATILPDMTLAEAIETGRYAAFVTTRLCRPAIIPSPLSA